MAQAPIMELIHTVAELRERLSKKADTLAHDAFFVYPEELKSVARIQVFRDFLVANAQRWHF